jgi:serine phosphatase RsbU (regulator of sigma subunit)
MEVWGGNQVVDDSVVVAGLDAWVYSKPYGGSEGGGDVYYLSSCATGRIARLLLADVSGHGQAVGSMAVDLRELMRRFVNQIDHTQFIRLMNRQFATMAKAGKFATAVVSTFFAPTARLTICNAGHPVPVYYRAATKQWSFLESNEKKTRSEAPVNLPLGILDLADYQTFDVQLKTGDLVLCYTDSLVESRGADGELLGQEGLMEIVRSVPIGQPREFVSDLLNTIESRYQGNLTNDDVSVLLFRPNGLGRRPSLITQAVAVGKMTAAIVRSLRPGGPPVPWPDFKLPNIGGAIIPAFSRLWRTSKADS